MWPGAAGDIQLPGTILTLFSRSIKGSLSGGCNPTTDIPKILGLYQAGDLKLDELIACTCAPSWSVAPS
jgi:S-(hydroxymethyl)glutathione dehydrogenase/alcohol dehydrogenase